MNLYHLCPIEEDIFRSSNMETHIRFIIRAETEEQAREIAKTESGFPLWLNSEIVSCTPLTLGCEDGILFSEKKLGYNKSLSKLS